MGKISSIDSLFNYLLAREMIKIHMDESILFANASSVLYQCLFFLYL